MWSRLINCFKHLWKSPFVQFICYSLLEWVVVIFHRSTKHKFKKNQVASLIDECTQDYTVGTTESTVEVKQEQKQETAKDVVVEKPKRIRKTTKKKTIEKVEETKPAKPRRRVKKTTEDTAKKTTTRKPRTRKKKTETNSDFINKK